MGNGVAGFPWAYDGSETSHFLDGHVIVALADGEPVEIVAGNPVTLPAGLSCNLEGAVALRKRYRFSWTRLT